MRKLRVLRPRRGVRWFAVPVLALLAAVFLVPGVARADAPIPTLPTPSGSDPIGGIVGGLTGNSAPTQPSTPADPAVEQQSSQPDTTSSEQSGLPAPPSLPPQLQAALAQLGVSPECSDAIQKDLTKTLTDIPGSVQAIIDELTKQLGGGPPDPQAVLAQLAEQLDITLPAGNGTTTTASTEQGTGGTSSDVPIIDDLQALVTDLLTTCAPATQTSTAPPPPPPGNQPQQPVQAAAPPVAQPVSYPGYAPTGSIAPQQEGRTGGEVPLAALGGVLVLVSGAAVTVTRWRTRAAREEA